eukprot:928872_1
MIAQIMASKRTLSDTKIGAVCVIVTQQLRGYFTSQTVTFLAISMSDEIVLLNPPEVVASEEITPINYGYYASLSIAFLFVIIAMIAYCYNDGVCCKFPHIQGCATVDDGKYIAMVLFALHFYDFNSDVNLTYSND